jgi:hypothetical protein
VRCRLHPAGPGYGSEAGFCENYNEPFGVTEGQNFLAS